ncbi:HEAT repeat domain-containing protein [Treponema sp. TIM-1]|uniref:HEAT repeat domain-containing protein n=1 Tax=Treponema sp. TIM-1 TaxID=2898417 RepID=UPI003980FFFA
MIICKKFFMGSLFQNPAGSEKDGLTSAFSRLALLKKPLVTMVIFMMVTMAWAQQSSTDGEISVEESYLQQSIENMIIRDQSRTGGRDEKLIAMEYIEDAISRGNTSKEVLDALEYLSLEGLTNKTRENGRVINNFPDIRKRAVTNLGNIGTPEAKNTIIRLVISEPEPMVLTEAFKSLAKIGLNENGETVNAIAWVVNRFESGRGDEQMAISALEAFEILSEKNKGVINNTAITTISRIASSNHYNRLIRDQARLVLDKLRLQAAEVQSKNK